MAISDLTVESHSRNERRRARNRDALVAAARHQFERNGFEATTIAGIAEEADLGFGTFYRYFADKEAALRAVLDDAGAEMDAVVVAEDDAAVPAADALAHLIERFVVAGSRNRDLFALWWQLSLGARKAATGRNKGPHLPMKLGQAVERIIRRGVEDGRFAASDPALTAQFIASGLMFVLAPVPQALPVTQVAAALTELAFNALGVQDVRRRGRGAAGRGQ